MEALATNLHSWNTEAFPYQTALETELKQNIEDKKTAKESWKQGPDWRLASYGMASAFHSIAALNKLYNLNIFSSQKKIDNISLGASKIAHTLSYGYLAYEAIKDNRILDGIAKALDPLISNFSSLENINLMKGIGGGLNTIDFAQTKRVSKEGTWIDSLKSSFKAASQMVRDIYTINPLSKSSKILKFPKEEKGHTLALAGHTILFSSLLGLCFKPLNKVMNVIRHIGAFAANTVNMYHPDGQKKSAGSIFNIHSTLDALQKFLPKETADIINNLNMAIYNIAIYLYGNLSSKRTRNTFKQYNL